MSNLELPQRTKMVEIGRAADRIAIVRAICEGPGDEATWTPCGYPDCQCSNQAALDASTALDSHGLMVVAPTSVTRLRQALEAAHSLFVAFAAENNIPDDKWALDWAVIEEFAL